MVKVIIFGDSIGWGAFDTQRGGWVERLKIDYLKTFKQQGISIYNQSISGDTTRGVLNRLESTIKNMMFSEKEEFTLLFSIGTNDASYIKDKDNFEITIEEFRENIIEIISISKNLTNKIIFTGFSKVDENKTNPWLDYPKEKIFWENSELLKYEKELKEICIKEDIPLIELFKLLEDSDLSDGVHPNEKGHEKIYKKVKEYLENEY